MRFTLLIFTLLIFPSCASFAQLIEFKDLRTKDQSQFEKAKELYFSGDNERAAVLVSEIVDHAPGFAEGYMLLGDIESECKDFNRAASYYKKVIDLTESYSPLVYLLRANAEFQAKQYKEAIVSYTIYLEKNPADPENLENALERLTISKFRDSVYQHPIDFQPVNLGGNINTEADEFVNSITADETLLYFTTQRNLGEEMKVYRKEYEEYICYSERNNDSWSRAVKLNLSAGLISDEGAMCISADGNLIIFTSCFREDTYGSCDLYQTRKTEHGWSTPKNLGIEVNSDNWDAQPALSPDGQTLYFASNRQGGYGSSDLWRSFLLDDGSWGKPENLGQAVNSGKSEMSPFIHFDNQTLYFSSDGHPGLGEVDLFMTRKTGENEWKEPVNLGYPLNDENNDLAIMISATGEQGFISAIRDEGFGGYDIYSFVLPDNIRPYSATYLEGTVLDASSLQPLNAAIQLFELVEGELLMDLKTDEEGKFLVCLPTDREYGLNVKCDGYLFYSRNISLQGDYSYREPYREIVYLQPAAEGSMMVLNNVFFEFDSYLLKTESYPELDRLKDFLEKNPDIRILISGHTDNIGTREYNLELSAKRAESVYLYLTSVGISANRLSYTGYGPDKPVASNDSEEGRAGNRRTEVTIIK